MNTSGKLARVTDGLPIVLPFARAFSMPDITRCRIILRSISANTPHIIIIPCVMGSSSSLVQSTLKSPIIIFSFFSLAMSIISHKCLVERVKRDTSVVTMVSPGLATSSNLLSLSRLFFAPLSCSGTMFFP